MHTDELLEVMFGTEHVIAELFWNIIFGITVYLFSKAVALRKIHKYVDSKHGVTHDNDNY